jgi:hypothetical protein
MMQCSSAGPQIQYSCDRIFFGFEDEIAGAGASLRFALERLEMRQEVASGYHRDLCAVNQ